MIKFSVIRSIGLAILTIVSISTSSVLVLQQGLNGYSGVFDKELRKADGNYNAKVTPSDQVMLALWG